MSERNRMNGLSNAKEGRKKIHPKKHIATVDCLGVCESCKCECESLLSAGVVAVAAAVVTQTASGEMHFVNKTQPNVTFWHCARNVNRKK